MEMIAVTKKKAPTASGKFRIGTDLVSKKYISENANNREILISPFDNLLLLCHNLIREFILILHTLIIISIPTKIIYG